MLIPRAAQDEFVSKLQEVYVFRTPVAIHILSAHVNDRYKSFYSEDISESDSYTRIVSQAHAARIKRYIDNTRGKVVIGGQVDVEKRFVAPTVIKDVPFDDSTMEEYVLLPLWLDSCSSCIMIQGDIWSSSTNHSCRGHRRSYRTHQYQVSFPPSGLRCSYTHFPPKGNIRCRSTCSPKTPH